VDLAIFTKKVQRKVHNENWKGLGSARDWLTQKCRNAEKRQVTGVYHTFQGSRRSQIFFGLGWAVAYFYAMTSRQVGVLFALLVMHCLSC